MARSLLAGQFGIAQLYRPLLDVQAELRKRKRQIVHSAEQPAKGDPVVSGEISQNTGCLSSSMNRRMAWPMSSRGIPPPLSCGRTVSRVQWLALVQSISLLSAEELAAVFSHETDADQIDTTLLRFRQSLRAGPTNEHCRRAETSSSGRQRPDLSATRCLWILKAPPACRAVSRPADLLPARHQNRSRAAPFRPVEHVPATELEDLRLAGKNSQACSDCRPGSTRRRRRSSRRR